MIGLATFVVACQYLLLQTLVDIGDDARIGLAVQLDAVRDVVHASFRPCGLSHNRLEGSFILHREVIHELVGVIELAVVHWHACRTRLQGHTVGRIEVAHGIGSAGTLVIEVATLQVECVPTAIGNIRLQQASVKGVFDLLVYAVDTGEHDCVLVDRQIDVVHLTRAGCLNALFYVGVCNVGLSTRRHFSVEVDVVLMGCLPRLVV